MESSIDAASGGQSLIESFRKADIDFSLFFHASPVPTAISTVEGGRMVDVNESFLRLIQSTREELLGRSGLDLSIWVRPKRRESIVQAVRKDGSLTGFPMKLRTRLGGIRETLASSSFFQINGVDYLISSFYDITEQKRAKEALEASEKRLQEIVDLTSDWIWEIDDQGSYTFVSTRIKELAGYAPEELIGKPYSVILHPDAAKRVVEMLGKSWERREPAAFFESTVLHKDGSHIFIEASGTPILDNQGNFRGYRGVCRNITMRKQAETLLKLREEELENERVNLEETNAALRVLLRQRENDKRELEEKLLVNAEELIQPYVAKLKASLLDSRQKACLDVLESHLKDLISPFLHKMKSQFMNLTPMEIKVASLIKDGRTTKEMAALLNVSDRSVEFHRHHIRVKLGLNNRKVNLQTYLASLQ
ncbi:MAG: PAS domain S-box protein [Deltaproteobacteria bacterium]|nr:PAS domain S-box protein [Deltaproteobacteria bacterium]